jgi:hypothetical protein
VMGTIALLNSATSKNVEEEMATEPFDNIIPCLHHSQRNTSQSIPFLFVQIFRSTIFPSLGITQSITLQKPSGEVIRGTGGLERFRSFAADEEPRHGQGGELERKMTSIKKELLTASSKHNGKNDGNNTSRIQEYAF